MKNAQERAQEIIATWKGKNGGYDNLKDAILDCHEVLKELKSESSVEKEIIDVLTEATTDMQRLIDEDPEGWKNWKDLVDPKYVKK